MTAGVHLPRYPDKMFTWLSAAFDVVRCPPGQAVCAPRRGGITSLPPVKGGSKGLRMLLPLRCAFADSHFNQIDTLSKTTGRTGGNELPSRLARWSSFCHQWFSRAKNHELMGTYAHVK